MPGGAKRPSRKSLVEEFLASQHPAEITAPTLAGLRRYVVERLGGARVSDRYLVELAEKTGLPVAREVGGLPPDLRDRVHFHDLAAAESSLLDLLREYQWAPNPARAADCRRAVLRAKDRLASLLGRAPLSAARRAEKQEIHQWFLVWLETPDLFPAWLALRKKYLDS